MTPAQQQALTQATELLSEHFEGHLIIVDYDTSDTTAQQQLVFDGGRIRALGLCELARVTLVQTTSPQNNLEDTSSDS